LIKAIRHTGIVVRNLDKSISFYCDILGFSVSSRKKETGFYIEQIVGIPGVRLEWAKLKIQDGSLIELIQYHSDACETASVENYPSDRLGCSHIAFTVSDIEGLYKLLHDKGCHCNSLPMSNPECFAKVMYCHDPDGIIIEFVEEVSAEL